MEITYFHMKMGQHTQGIKSKGPSGSEIKSYIKDIILVPTHEETDKVLRVEGYDCNGPKTKVIEMALILFFFLIKIGHKYNKNL